jgi:hypothetical protein
MYNYKSFNINNKYLNLHRHYQLGKVTQNLITETFKHLFENLNKVTNDK